MPPEFRAKCIRIACSIYQEYTPYYELADWGNLKLFPPKNCTPKPVPATLRKTIPLKSHSLPPKTKQHSPQKSYTRHLETLHLTPTRFSERILIYAQSPLHTIATPSLREILNSPPATSPFSSTLRSLPPSLVLQLFHSFQLLPFLLFQLFLVPSLLPLPRSPLDKYGAEEI